MIRTIRIIVLLLMLASCGYGGFWFGKLVGTVNTNNRIVSEMYHDCENSRPITIEGRLYFCSPAKKPSEKL